MELRLQEGPNSGGRRGRERAPAWPEKDRSQSTFFSSGSWWLCLKALNFGLVWMVLFGSWSIYLLFSCTAWDCKYPEESLSWTCGMVASGPLSPGRGLSGGPMETSMSGYIWQVHSV